MKDELRGALTAEQVYFRQVLQLSDLASLIFRDTSTEWQVNARNYEMAVRNFEMSASPFLDNEYYRKKSILEIFANRKLTEYREKNKKVLLTKQGRDFEMVLALEVSRRLAALVLLALQRRGLLKPQRFQDVEITGEGAEGEEAEAEGTAGEGIEPGAELIE